MSIKEHTSLQFNGLEWKVSTLAEKVILLEASLETDIGVIHDSTHFLEAVLGSRLSDIVPAYHSIALFSDLSQSQLLEILKDQKISGSDHDIEKEIIKIPICYEMGEDLAFISKHAGMDSESVIDLHLSGSYRSLFIGFTPGFIYADGLDPRLTCPRRSNPRTKIPAGSVGIGGSQTGIYSLDSPGGWNLLGRTPVTLFDVTKNPPMTVEVGTSFSFYRISTKEFEEWGN